MKKITRLTAGALALVSAAAVFTGCNSDSAAPNSDSSAAATTTELYQVVSEDSNVINAVSNVSVAEDMKDIKVDTKIKWMAWWNIQEATPAVEMFKNLYGVPKNKPEGYEDTPDDNVFVNIKVTSYADRYSQLATRVQSDDSPDCYPFEIVNYPYSVFQNLFQPIDGVIDFTTDDWVQFKDSIDKFVWGGHNYCSPIDVTPYSLLWYRKSVAEEAGLDDPWELYEKGEWTWSRFMEMARQFTDLENKRYAIDGYLVENAFVATTGTPLIGIEDGRLVSNLNNANIEKCMDMILKFDDTQEGLRYPRELENNWNTSIPQWVNGNTLFFEDGTWRYEEHWQKFKKKQGWADDEINFVPFPQMDGSDKYYQGMKFDAIMLCAGAKNIDGYKAWIYANILSINDPEVKAAGREQSKNEYNWTDTLLDRLDLLKQPDTFEPVYDFKNGIGTDIADGGSGEAPVSQLTFFPSMNGETYTAVRAANQGVIDTRIKELNDQFAE